MRYRFIWCLLPVLLLGGCGGMTLGGAGNGWRNNGVVVKEIPASELMHQGPYTLAPEDMLLVHVWDVPEFSSSASISPTTASSASLGASQSVLNTSGAGSSGVTAVIHGDGTVDLPLIGSIMVAGDTTEQAKQRIAKALEQYVINPKVGVTVLQYNSRKILVLGEVQKPGIVLNPGPRLSLAEALAQAGSINNITANRRHVYIIRGVMGQPRVSLVDLHTAIGMFTAQNIWLKRRDVVYVDSRLITDWNRFISQLLPTVGAAVLGKTVAP